jgi:hypothetical protein
LAQAAVLAQSCDEVRARRRRICATIMQSVPELPNSDKVRHGLRHRRRPEPQVTAFRIENLHALLRMRGEPGLR